MNEDVNNVFEKFSEILKEKDIDLNSIMGNQQSKENSENTNNNDFSFDINTIMKIKSIIDNMNNKNTPRNQLLMSLKPYLEDEKKEKLEQYIKIANLLSVLGSLDEQKSFKFLKDSQYDFVLMLILFLLIF